MTTERVTGPIPEWDETKPDGDTQSVSQLDDEQINDKVATRKWTTVEHEGPESDQAGQHKLGSGKAFMDTQAGILALRPRDYVGSFALALDTLRILFAIEAGDPDGQWVEFARMEGDFTFTGDVNVNAGQLFVGGVELENVPVGGMIRFPATVTVPTNYLDCDGAQYDTVVEATLYNVLGTRFNLDTDANPNLFRVPNIPNENLGSQYVAADLKWIVRKV